MATGPRDATRQHPGAASFGYPKHRLVGQEKRTNAHGVALTDVTAACGFSETKAGRFTPDNVGSARTGEFCEKGCWA